MENLKRYLTMSRKDVDRMAKLREMEAAMLVSLEDFLEKKLEDGAASLKKTMKTKKLQSFHSNASKTPQA